MTKIKELAGRAIFISLISAGLRVVAVAGEPLEQVRDAVDKAIPILKDPKLQSKEKKRERVDRLKEIVHPLFDYQEMAKWTFGPHWRRRSPTERDEFVRLFREFVERIYSDNVDSYKGEEVVFGRESLDQDFAEVDSKVVNAKGEDFPSSTVCGARKGNGRFTMSSWKISASSTITARSSIGSSRRNLTRSWFGRYAKKGDEADQPFVSAGLLPLSSRAGG